MKELKKEDEELTNKEKVSPWSTVLFVGRYSWSYSELGLRMCTRDVWQKGSWQIMWNQPWYCANSPGLPRILLGNRMKFHGNHSLQNILPSSKQGTCSLSDMGLGWCLKSLGNLPWFITQSLIIAPHPLTPKIWFF